MADPRGAILVDPMDEDDPIDDNEHVNILDEVFTQAWPEVNRHQPHSFLEIDGRENTMSQLVSLRAFNALSISQQNVNQTVNQRCSNPLLLKSSPSKATQKKE
jgi:hypothetical protein